MPTSSSTVASALAISGLLREKAAGAFAGFGVLLVATLGFEGRVLSLSGCAGVVFSEEAL